MTQQRNFYIFTLTHLSLSDGTFVPSRASELLLEVECFQSFAHDLGLGGVWELDTVLGQMEVINGVLLAGNTGDWAIDENLNENTCLLLEPSGLFVTSRKSLI